MSRLDRLEREQHHRSIVPQTSGESVVQQLQSMTIGPSPRAATFDDRAAFQSGRSLTSSHAIVQSPPSDVGRTDGAGKGAGVHDGGRRGEGQQSRLPIAARGWH